MTRAGLATLAAMAAFAVPANAATLAADKPCYVEGEDANITGQGFTPGAPVGFAFDGVPSGEVPADAAGNVFAGFTAPSLGGRAVREYTVVATDGANPANTGTTEIAVTAQSVDVVPARAAPNRRVRFRLRGLLPGRTVYVHYVYRRRERARQSLGRTKRPCGTLSVRKRFFPQSRVQRGTWTLQFDHRRRYSPRTQPALSGQVQVFQVIRPAARPAASWSLAGR